MTNSNAKSALSKAEETMQAYQEKNVTAQEQAAEQTTAGTVNNKTAEIGTPDQDTASAANVNLPQSTASTASRSSSVKTLSLPAPKHFIHRADGTITPLVAVDELPAFLHIFGVSRLLTKAHTQGMISLGTMPRGSKPYTVQMVDPSTVADDDDDDHAFGTTVDIPTPSSRASDATSIKGDGSRKESVKRWVHDVSQDDDTQVSYTLEC